MKKNDSGDFCILYIEPGDERAVLFPVIASQLKPVVLMLADQIAVFQRPDDFVSLKRIKRQYNLTIVFIIVHSDQRTQFAVKNGFPVYASMDELMQAVSAGQMVRQRTNSRLTEPLLQHPEELKVAIDNERSFVSQLEQTDSSKRIAPPLPATEASTPVRTSFSFSSVAADEKPATPAPESLLFWSQHAPTASFMTEQEMEYSTRPSPSAPTAFSTSSSSVRPAASFMPPEDLPYPSAPQQAAASRRHIPVFVIVLSVILILLIVGSSLLFPHLIQSSPAATGPANMGTIVFTSSEQINENTSQGISDQIVVNLHNLTVSDAQNKLYAWLLSDQSQSDPTSLLLGVLSLKNGSATLTYPGDAQHTNLLALYSRFLITEENGSVAPISPTTNQNEWRYYGQFSSTPINGPDNPKHFSYLDHLRHLLAADPTLDELQLPGGLNNWLFDNTEKVFEWSSSMRGSWEESHDAGFTRRMATRILEYLDGTTYLGMDIPVGAPLLVNERLARVGLLTVAGPDQEPPSYLTHIDSHLDGLLQASHADPNLSRQIAALTATLSNIQQWLTQVRTDAQKLVKETDAQLAQAPTLNVINDMIVNSNYAYAGDLNPATNITQPGVLWLHDHIQALATMNITAFTSSTAITTPKITTLSASTQASLYDYAAKK